MKKEKMAPSKKMQKPAARVEQRKYAADKEKYDKKMSREIGDYDSRPKGIADAMNRASEGYSKKPRVVKSKKKGSGF